MEKNRTYEDNTTTPWYAKTATRWTDTHRSTVRWFQVAGHPVSGNPAPRPPQPPAAGLQVRCSVKRDAVRAIGARLFVLTPGTTADDFIGASHGFRRVLRYGTADDVRAVAVELRYLMRLTRRAERRHSRIQRDEAA